MKRILILTADVGFGHISAANAIRAALEARHDHACQVDVVNPLQSQAAPRLMRHNARDYDRLVRRWPRVYGLAYSATNRHITNSLVNQAYTSLLQTALRRLLLATTPDLVITTYPYYQSPLAAVCRDLSAPPRIMTVVTDFVTVHRAWFHTGADFCCVPTVDAARRAVNYGFDPDKIRITGIPVHPDMGRTRAKPDLRRELSWRTDLPTLLVMGSKRVDRLPGLLERINAARLPLQLAVVCGGDEAIYRTLTRMTWTCPAHMVAHSPFDFFGHPMVVHAPAHGLADQIDLVAATLEPVLPKLEQIDCTLVIETIRDRHPRPLLTLLDTIDASCVRMSIDVGHVYIGHLLGGPTPDQWVHEAGPRLAHVHLQDTDGDLDRHWPPGMGEINWEAFFGALRTLPVQPRLIIELVDGTQLPRAAGWLTDQGLAR